MQRVFPHNKCTFGGETGQTTYFQYEPQGALWTNPCANEKVRSSRRPCVRGDNLQGSLAQHPCGPGRPPAGRLRGARDIHDNHTNTHTGAHTQIHTPAHLNGHMHAHMCTLTYGVAQKTCLLFPYHGPGSARLSPTSSETTLLDCIVTAVISACVFKNLSEW